MRRAYEQSDEAVRQWLETRYPEIEKWLIAPAAANIVGKPASDISQAGRTDLVIVAERLGLARLETTRASQPPSWRPLAIGNVQRRGWTLEALRKNYRPRRQRGC